MCNRYINSVRLTRLPGQGRVVVHGRDEGPDVDHAAAGRVLGRPATPAVQVIRLRGAPAAWGPSRSLPGSRALARVPRREGLRGNGRGCGLSVSQAD